MAQRPALLSTFVFLDLETTGLPSACFNPEITELCMLAISRFAVEDSNMPIRVQNKLNLCFHPSRSMHPIASKVSGLNSTNLFHQKDFDCTAVKLIQLFLSRLDPPICLLAHNGKRFDYPLLRAHLTSVKGPKFDLTDCHKSPIFCADTLPMFTALNDLLLPKLSQNDSGFDSTGEIVQSSTGSKSVLPLASSSPKKSSNSPSDRISFRLGDIYSRVFGSSHLNAHSAEGDCVALIHLVQFLGLSAVDWLQTNYFDFNQITPSYILTTSRPSSTTEFPYYRRSDTSGAKNTEDATVIQTTSDMDSIRLE